MRDVRQELRDLVERAQQLHAAERQATIESVLLVGEFWFRNAAVNLCMTLHYFASTIGLTVDQYLKRAQAARVIQRFPQALDMLRAGQTRVSHLSLVAAKVTEANARILLEGIRNKSKREVMALLSRVTRDGRVLEKEGVVEVRVTLTESQLAAFDRAREVLSHGGHVPTNAEIVVKALDDMLDKRDPLRKAARAAARKKGQEPASNEETVDAPSHEDLRPCRPVMPSTVHAPEHEGLNSDVLSNAAPGHGPSTITRRPPIPAYVRHAVWLRDAGQCTWRQHDGRRCKERMMLELDHIQMFCHGGKHELRNLTLRCRLHNQAAAEQQLGAAFMARARNGTARRAGAT